MHLIIEQQFCEIVNATLKRDGITRSELGRRMGVSPQFVTDYLNGRRVPTAGTMERFFEALKLKPKLVVEEMAEPVTADA